MVAYSVVRKCHDTQNKERETATVFYCFTLYITINIYIHVTYIQVLQRIHFNSIYKITFVNMVH